jgi:hypothetical protein
VYFSGFSDANKQYSVEFKNQLAKMVTDLGGEVRFDNEFNEHITHVVRHPLSIRLHSVGHDEFLSAYEEFACSRLFLYFYYLYISVFIFFILSARHGVALCVQLIISSDPTVACDEAIGRA